MTSGPLLWALPWLLGTVAFAVVARFPPELPGLEPDAGAFPPEPEPLVSAVVPARNEAHNIERVLGSLAASRYPRLEVVVVDDQSGDGTGALARAVLAGRLERLCVVDGAPPPAGWLGKPWACAQGAREARGDLLLFTDADTVHGEDLLTRAVAALERGPDDAVTVMGRQVMESFWERLVQPHVFAVLVARFPRPPTSPDRWRHAIANGQFILIRRSVYDAMGGHEAVKGEVVEDLRLAQILVRGGRRLAVHGAEEAFATRMYRSLGELVAGWSKNMAVGARQSVPAWASSLILPASVSGGAVLWVMPPLALGAALLRGEPSPLLTWSLVTCAISAAFWAGVCRRLGAPARYGLIYPLGALVFLIILVRSWWRGRRVSWKGREYTVGAADHDP